MSESTLQRVCVLVTDGTHDTPRPVSSGYPLIKAKEIVGGRIDFDGCAFVSEEDHIKIIARSKPEKGDTLFAHIGASLGEAAYVGTNREFSIKNIALFKPNPKVINGRYLYYLTISPQFQQLAKNTRTGSAQPFLSLDHLRRHSIRYHTEVTDQLKIVAMLSAYDDLIENNTCRIKTLEEMTRLIYNEWFVNFRFPGFGKVRMLDSQAGPIPESWGMTTLGAVADVQWGDTSTTKAAYVEDGYDAYSASGLDGKLDHYDFDRDGIVLSAIGANCGRTWFAKGKWSCIKNTIRFWATAATASNEYLFVATGDMKYWTRRGAAQPFISQTDARNSPLLVPSQDIMERFTAFSGPCLKEIHALEKANVLLRRTRDLLLQKLISGELDVENLDIAVPEAAPNAEAATFAPTSV